MTTWCVGVCTYNRLAYTQACLRTLPVDGRVVVLDMGSTDGTRAWLETWRREDSAQDRRVILSAINEDCGGAWRRLVPETDGASVVVTLDNDMVTTAPWGPMVEAVFDADPSIGAISLRDNPKRRDAQYGPPRPARDVGGVSVVRVARVFSAVAYRGDVFRACIAQTIKPFLDVEGSKRVRQAGYTLARIYPGPCEHRQDYEEDTEHLDYYAALIDRHRHGAGGHPRRAARASVWREIRSLEGAVC